jgi:carbamoylphosphate synthase large subunit
VIACERPSGILLTFGGQTALNCGVELYRNKVFEKYGVKIMGTPIQSIIESEDRQLFATKVQEIGEQVAPSKIVKNIEEAVAAGKELGYPVCNIIYLCVGTEYFSTQFSISKLYIPYARHHKPLLITSHS